MPMEYQWYTSGSQRRNLVVTVLPVGSSGIPVEIRGKIWWFYQWYSSGFQCYTSRILVVLPVFSSGLPEEISGKIWRYYNCYPDNIGRPLTSVLPLFYQWHYNQILLLTFLRRGLQFSVIIRDGSSWVGPVQSR